MSEKLKNVLFALKNLDISLKMYNFAETK